MFVDEISYLYVRPATVSCCVVTFIHNYAKRRRSPVIRDNTHANLPLGSSLRLMTKSRPKYTIRSLSHTSASSQNRKLAAICLYNTSIKTSTRTTAAATTARASCCSCGVRGKQQPADLSSESSYEYSLGM